VFKLPMAATHGDLHPPVIRKHPQNHSDFDNWNGNLLHVGRIGLAAVG
jgi:hypothetical protein